MNRSAKKLILASLCLVLVLSTLPFLITDDAQGADGDISYYWDGEGADYLATTAGNWYENNGGTITDDVTPTSLGRVIFDSTSTKNCTLNFGSSLTLYSFTVSSGYTGIITVADNVSIGVGSTSLSAGTLTGSTSYTWTNQGDFTTNTGCTVTPETLVVDMTGEGKSFLGTNGPSVRFYKMLISGNTTYGRVGGGVTILEVDAGKTFNIGNGKILTWYQYNTGASITNNGVISSTGTGYFQLFNRLTADFPNLGTFSSNILIERNSGGQSSDSIITLKSSFSTTGYIQIKSSHATYLCKLDTAGYDLSASSIIYGTRGAIVGGEGTITTVSWDSSAGTWTPETSNVHFTGTGTVKTAAGQTFYNLTVGAGSSVTQSSNVVVSEWMELDGGAWTKGAYTLTAPLMTLSSTMSNGNEDTAYTYTPTSDQPITSINVVTNATWLSIVGTSVVGAPTNTEVGTFYVNVTCTNIIGSVSQNSTITISNTAPVWLTTDYSTEWSYGMTYSYDPTASDEGAGLTYSITTSAIELRCDPASGAIRGKVMDNSITVSLMADDGNGGVIWQNWTITAMGFSWDGDVLVNYTEGQNLKVTFNASLTNATYNAIIKTVQWNFGDGNGSRVLDLMPMHPYERAGTYMVTCYIVTEDDMTATKNFQITVGDPAVVEDLEAQYAERMNQAVLISGLACAAGLVIIACYIKIAGRRGWINRLVPVMILLAMLAISATLIGSAMQ